MLPKPVGQQVILTLLKFSSIKYNTLPSPIIRFEDIVYHRLIV